ncbi:hypothetical protein ABTZ99_13485 [Actinosynnema sp. NPDC002837]
MTTRTTLNRTATYLGGPLDGQQVSRTSGPFPLYRDDDGNPMNPRDGDRGLLAHLADGAASFYTRRLVDADATTVTHAYVHTTALIGWALGTDQVAA